MRGRRRDTLLALWNLSLRIPEAQRFSRIYRWRKELIDHIFVSTPWSERSLKTTSPPTPLTRPGRPLHR
jgi:hypothetical protein